MKSSTTDRQLDLEGNWVYAETHVSNCNLFWQLKYGFSLEALDNYLEEEGWDTPIAQVNREYLLGRRAKALAAQKAHDDNLVEALLSHLALAIRLGKRLELIIPPANLGKKFSAGRKVGAVGPVKAAVRRYLKKRPRALPAEIWDYYKAKPPRGLAFCETPKDRYIEIDLKVIKGKLPPDANRYQYVYLARFRNIVAEERKLIDSENP